MSRKEKRGLDILIIIVVFFILLSVFKLGYEVANPCIKYSEEMRCSGVWDAYECIKEYECIERKYK